MSEKISVPAGSQGGDEQGTETPLQSPGALRGPAQRIQSIDRAAALLKTIAGLDRPAGVTELAEELGLNRSTAWRLLGTLEYHRLIERDPSSQGYILGPELANLGSARAHDSIVRLVHPVMTDCAASIGQTLTLAVPNALGVTYVHQVDPPGTTKASWVGQSPSLHATSTGKVFLAWMPRREADTFLRAPLAKYTPRTITEPEALQAELAATRARGFGICDREYEEYSSGVAAPVLGHSWRPVAIIATWTVTQNALLGAARQEAGRVVMSAAAEIEHTLGTSQVKRHEFGTTRPAS